MVLVKQDIVSSVITHSCLFEIPRVTANRAIVIIIIIIIITSFYLCDVLMLVSI